MIIVQLLVFCGLFTFLVRLSVIGGAINALYFYPLNYQEIACKRGIANKEVVMNKRKKFMIPFVLTMFISLLLIIGLWIKPTTFIVAYLYSLLFLEVMNWYDGIIIDRVWVGHSKFWLIPGMEDVNYVPSVNDVLKKRIKLTFIFAILSFIPATIIYFINIF